MTWKTRLDALLVYAIVFVSMALTVAACYSAQGSPYVVFPLNASGSILTDEQSVAAASEAAGLIGWIEAVYRKDPAWRYGDAMKTVRGEWAVPVTQSVSALVTATCSISLLTESDFPVATLPEGLK